MNTFYLLDFYGIHSETCPYNKANKETKKRGRPPLPEHIKTIKKEEHKEHMKEYQRKQRAILTEEQKQELNRKSKEHYHINKENIKKKKKEINELSKEVTYILRDLYLSGNILPMTQEQKSKIDKFFNLPFKNI